MSKYIFSFCLVLGLFSSSLAPAQGSGALTLEAFQMMRANPQVSGVLIFESAATRYNQQIDRNYAQVPREHRPYVTAPHVARLIDGLMKKYRAGDQAGALEFITILDVKAPLEDKVNFVENITRIYLRQPSQ